MFHFHYYAVKIIESEIEYEAAKEGKAFKILEIFGDYSQLGNAQ